MVSEAATVGLPDYAPTVSEAPRSEALPDLQRRLIWLAAFRVAAVTVLVGTAAILALRSDTALGGRLTGLLSGVAVATNLLQIAIVLLLRLRRWLKQLAVAEIAGDVAFATALVYLTGGSESLFSFLFLLAIVNGSILLSTRGAWLAGLASLVADWTLILGMRGGFIPAASDLYAPAARLSFPELAQALITHSTAFALTAVLSSYLAGQIRRAGERVAEAESSLVKLHVLHDGIVRSIASGIVTTDERGRVTFLNRAGEEILGVRGGELAGRPLEELFPGLRPSMRVAAERAGQPSRVDFAWSGPDGADRFLGFTVNPLFDGQGRRLGLAGVFQDLTRFRELELQAKRAEQLAAVGKLAAGLAHELRNPLASMSGSVELLAADRAKAPEERRLLEIVFREADRLNRLVTEFLAFARPATPTPSEVSLRSLAEEVLSVFGADPLAGRIQLDAKLDEAQAWADGGQLKQVLWNLLLNAAQATPPGGTVRLRSGTGPEDGEVFIEVADDGPGIEAEDLPRIFEPFFTTKDGGTGLGLATVHRILDAHGGRVLVDGGGAGRGARFTVVLPRRDTAPAAAGEAAA